MQNCLRHLQAWQQWWTPSSLWLSRFEPGAVSLYNCIPRLRQTATTPKQAVLLYHHAWSPSPALSLQTVLNRATSCLNYSTEQWLPKQQAPQIIGWFILSFPLVFLAINGCKMVANLLSSQSWRKRATAIMMERREFSPGSRRLKGQLGRW